MVLKNLKKIIIITLMLMIVFSLVSITNKVYAADEILYLRIQELMTESEPDKGYAIGNPNANGVTPTAMKLWNIVRSNAGYTSVEESDIYCIRAGQGFTNQSNASTDEYPNSFDIIAEKNAILNNGILTGEFTTQIDGTEYTVNVYNAILALLDTIYLAHPESSTTGLIGYDELVNNAMEYARENSLSDEFNLYSSILGTTNQLSETDVLAVQQAAVWYFTNYDQNTTENNNLYDKRNKVSWLNETIDGTTYSANNDTVIKGQSEILYKYLIRTAIENADQYSKITSNEVINPITVNTTKLEKELSADNSKYILGPINITENREANYDLNVEVKNGSSAMGYTLLDENKVEVESGKAVKDLIGNDFYISIPANEVTEISDITVDINVEYFKTTATVWTDESDLNNTQPVVIPERVKENEKITLTLEPEFDLALRKYITAVNNVDLTGSFSRVPNINTDTLQNGTTATYAHKKDPVTIKTGDIVTYNLTIYNEGGKAGRATKIVDQLPTGLKFVSIESGNFIEDPANPYDEGTNKLNLVRDPANTDNLEAYNGTTLEYETITINCEVTAKANTSGNTVLTNVAWISEEFDAVDNETIIDQQGADRDSEPGTTPNVNKDNMSEYKGNSSNKNDLTDNTYFYKGEQDDDDFEKLILVSESFDLKLIKRIVQVNNQNVPERIESIDTSELNVIKSDGTYETTAKYELNKEPVLVEKGDIVTYTFRIYNEGTIDGYATEITEDIPEGLEFVWSEKSGEELADDETLTDDEKEAVEFNQEYLWGKFQYDENNRITQISTDYLSKDKEAIEGDNLIEAFGENDGTKTEDDLSYKEVSVKLKVVAENLSGNVIRNEAAITEDSDEDGDDIDDRDSDPKIWKKYEDDEDFDNIVLQSFDLALRKFITAVSPDETIEEEEYLKDSDGAYTRAPQVDTSKLNTTDENGNLITTAEYNHTKEPLIVNHNDIVIYTLRVYNEGETDGYAAEITDYLPPYLEFVPGEFNDIYKWTVAEDGRTVKSTYLDDTLLKGAEENENGKIVLSYEEVQIMCRVKDVAPTNENITNIAEISKYLDKDKEPANDRDSSEDNVNIPDDENLPGYKDDEEGSYIPGQEDDDDFEKVIVKIFDLALRKWVTQAIVYEDGQEVITETGHQPYDDPEGVVKVDLDKRDINNVVVKFRYSIRVINEGEVAGYATEITDYVPQGLKFLPEDNPGWVDEGNNVISTRLLENTLLQPGEYADVEVVLTWINGEDNLDLKVNTAEISQDDNEYDIDDKDSTPDNKKPGEDDIDDAPVILTLITGQGQTYFVLALIILGTISIGIVLIKKYVL